MSLVRCVPTVSTVRVAPVGQCSQQVALGDDAGALAVRVGHDGGTDLPAGHRTARLTQCVTRADTQHGSVHR